MDKAREWVSRLKASVQRAYLGPEENIDLLLVALIAGGHVLLDDVPGVGKTTLARALAMSLGLGFERIQCTPDLLPTDILGVNYFNQKTQDFEYRPGPVLTNILLADEINRATPRTQSALLEAMQESQVTVAGVTRPLPRPFLVLATQNPIEMQGTYPLPEAQLDRFLLRLSLGYPGREAEKAMVLRYGAEAAPDVAPMLGGGEVLELQRQADGIFVSEAVLGYILDLVEASRSNPSLSLGASPRASLSLYRAARALAVVEGRDHVLPDDVKRLAAPVLAHRVILSPQARMRGTQAEEAIAAAVAAVPVPAEPVRVQGRMDAAGPVKP